MNLQILVAPTAPTTMNSRCGGIHGPGPYTCTNFAPKFNYSDLSVVASSSGYVPLRGACNRPGPKGHKNKLVGPGPLQAPSMGAELKDKARSERSERLT